MLRWVIPKEIFTHQIVEIDGWILEIKSEQIHRFTCKPERKKTTENERVFL